MNSIYRITCVIAFFFSFLTSCAGRSATEGSSNVSLCLKLFEDASANLCETSCNERVSVCTEPNSELNQSEGKCSLVCYVDVATNEVADQEACDKCLYSCLENDAEFTCDYLPEFSTLGYPTDTQMSVPDLVMNSSSSVVPHGSSAIGAPLDTTMISGPNGLKDRYAILVRPADIIINLCETTEPSIIQSCESFSTKVDAKQTLELFQHYDCAGGQESSPAPAAEVINYRVIPVRFGPVPSVGGEGTDEFPAIVSAVEDYDIALVCNINAEPVESGYLAADGMFQPYNDHDEDPENDTPIDMSGANAQFGFVYNSSLAKPFTYKHDRMAASGLFEPATPSNSFACAFDKGVTFVIPESECGDCNCRVVHQQTTTVSAYPTADKLIDLKAITPVIIPIPTVSIADPVLSSQAGLSSSQVGAVSSAMLSSSSATPLSSSVVVTKGDTYFTTPVTDTLERLNRQSTKFLGSIVAERNTDSGDTLRTYSIYAGTGGYTSNHEFRFSYKSYNGKNDILVQTAEGTVVSSTAGVVEEINSNGKTRVIEIPFNTSVELVTTTHTLTFSFLELLADSIYVVTIDGYVPQ